MDKEIKTVPPSPLAQIGGRRGWSEQVWAPDSRDAVSIFRRKRKEGLVSVGRFQYLVSGLLGSSCLRLGFSLVRGSEAAC